VNQQIDVSKRPLERVKPWRFDEHADDLRRSGGKRREWSGVDRRQRENRTIVILEFRMAVGMMMVQDAMRLQMAMNDRVSAAVLLAFVDVLGRRNREQPQCSAQDAGEQPRRTHGPNRT
jgi:hypothetical protein